MSQEPASLFVRLPVIYEGPEYLDFIAFGTGGVHFGIQKAEAANEPAPAGPTGACSSASRDDRPGTPGRHDPSWTAATRAVSPAHRTARKYGNAACQSPASTTSSADLAGTTARHPAAPLVRTKG